MGDQAYQLTPLVEGFGMKVSGLDLKADVSDAIKQKIIQDTHEHRLLIFEKQGKISGDRQAEISSWFGPLESTFYKHPKSPHPDVFRVSNDSTQGCTQVGRSGWHIDGSFQTTPFKIQTMHFWSVCRGGVTLFSPMKEVVESADEETRRTWERLSFVSKYGIVHPFVCAHPVTRDPCLIFHCGPPFVQAFSLATEEGKEQVFDREKTLEMCDKLSTRLEEHAYTREWEEGDFAIIDNLAVAHYAGPGTQIPVEEGGLRILHRTTVAGNSVPLHFEREGQKL